MTGETAREKAIARLMTVLDQFETPEIRRIYAEWIIEAILEAVREDQHAVQL